MSNGWDRDSKTNGLYSGHFSLGGKERTKKDRNSAPLVKLANNSLVDNRYSVDIETIRHRDTSEHKTGSSGTISVAGGQGTVNSDNSSVRPLTRDIALKLNGAKTASDFNKFLKFGSKTFKKQGDGGSNVPVYYRPPSSSSKGSQYGINSFLPPNFEEINKRQKKNTIPLIDWSKEVSMDEIASSVYEAQKGNDLNLDLDEEDSEPKGVWMNPVVREALSRQVNTEVEVKNLLWSLFSLAATKLVVSVASYIITLYELKRLPFQNSNAYYPPIRSEAIELGNINFYTVLSLKLFYGFLFLKVLSSVYRLSKGQDQCLNLPLNANQRALLGLQPAPISPENDGDDIDSNTQLVMKARKFRAEAKDAAYEIPKYSRSNVYSTRSVKTKPAPNPENQSLYPIRTKTDLSYDSQPKKTLHHSTFVSSAKSETEVNPKLVSKFQKNFDIDFNVSDSEDHFSRENILSSVIPGEKRERPSFAQRYGI